METHHHLSNKVILSMHELLKHIGVCHCRDKVALQFKETENTLAIANLAAGMKDNLVDNIHFVHLIYKVLTGDQV